MMNEIENYLNDVIVNQEKIIDICDASIGNFGAKCVAEAISECEGLEEIKLSNCEIKDEGALAIFEKLRTIKNQVTILDLSRN